MLAHRYQRDDSLLWLVCRWKDDGCVDVLRVGKTKRKQNNCPDHVLLLDWMNVLSPSVLLSDKFAQLWENDSRQTDYVFVRGHPGIVSNKTQSSYVLLRLASNMPKRMKICGPSRRGLHPRR